MEIKTNIIIKSSFFCIDEEKLLEKYKTVWNKIEHLKNFKLNTLLVYDVRYIKAKKKNI